MNRRKHGVGPFEGPSSHVIVLRCQCFTTNDVCSLFLEVSLIYKKPVCVGIGIFTVKIKSVRKVTTGTTPVVVFPHNMDITVASGTSF